LTAGKEMSLFNILARTQLCLVRHYGVAGPVQTADPIPKYGGAVKSAGGAFAEKGAADENAYFYNLHKEQLQKLKDLRAKADPRVKYEIVKLSQIPEVQKLMYDFGYPREPMVTHLNLCKGVYSIPDSDRIMEDFIKTYNMSLLATYKDKKQYPLGVAINGEFSVMDTHADIDKKIYELSNHKYAPVLAILHQVNVMGGKVVFEDFNTDSIFMVKYLTVRPEVSMEGLATGLLSRVIQQASALGYKGIKATVTHDGIKKAAMINGMEMVAEIKYDKFKYRGKTVFGGIHDHSGVAFMAMKLE